MADTKEITINVVVVQPSGVEITIPLNGWWSTDYIGTYIAEYLLFGYFVLPGDEQTYDLTYLSFDGKLPKPKQGKTDKFEHAQYSLMYSVKQLGASLKEGSTVKLLLETEAKNVYISTTEHIAPVPLEEYSFCAGRIPDVREMTKILFLDDDPPAKVKMVRRTTEGETSDYVPDEKIPEDSYLAYVITKKDGTPFLPEYLTTWIDANGKPHLAYLEGTTLAEAYELDKGFVWIGNTVTDKRKCLFGCKASKTGGMKAK